MEDQVQQQSNQQPQNNFDMQINKPPSQDFYQNTNKSYDLLNQNYDNLSMNDHGSSEEDSLKHVREFDESISQQNDDTNNNTRLDNNINSDLQDLSKNNDTSLIDNQQQQISNTKQNNDVQKNTDNNVQQENKKIQQQQQQQQQQQHQQQMVQPIEILGAVKVRDGLFLGDEFASQDLEFVIANKVTHIINCAGRQIFNQWTPVGVKYLTFYWLDDDRQLIFDDHDQVAKEIYDFIEEANQDASGILVHSVRGQSRACCVLSIYLMMKFKWTLLKSLEFVNSRRPNLEIRASFLQQLSAWERRTRETYPRRTDRWDELYYQEEEQKQQQQKKDNNTTICESPTNTKIQQHNPAYEELLLRNTFMNAQMQPVNFLQQWKEDVLTSISQSHRNKQKLKWGDNYDENLKHLLAREKQEDDSPINDDFQLPKVETHKRQFQGKSLLKQSKKKDIQENQKQQPEETKEKVQSEQSIIEQTPVNNKKALESQSFQEEIKESHKPIKKQNRNRPVTPLLSNNGMRNHDNSDLISMSPRSFREKDNNMLINQKQTPGSVKHKRSASSKKIIDKEQEEKERRDKFKAKIAWNATSPKGTGTPMQNIFNNKDQSEQSQLIKKQISDKSPMKSNVQNSNAFKRELLEKAKQSLAENSKVNVGLDIKTIQETLNKLTTTEAKQLTSSTSNNQLQNSQLPSNQVQKSQGNIINNNNINNFFIQNASLIELPNGIQNNAGNLIGNQGLNIQGQVGAKIIQGKTQTQNEQQPIKKIQAPIGQFHHKRANSGSIQLAQQIKHNLQQQMPFQMQNLQQPLQTSHRKNQLSENHLLQFQNSQLQLQQSHQNLQPLILSSQIGNTFDQAILSKQLSRPQSSQNKNHNNNLNNSNNTSRKDFKQVLQQLQKDSLTAMQNSQSFWQNQAKKFYLKSQQVNYGATSQNQIHNDSSLKVKQQAFMQLTQQMKNDQANNSMQHARPQSAQGQNSQIFKNQLMQNALLNNHSQATGLSSNKNRKLRKSNESLMQPQQQQLIHAQQLQQVKKINKHQRRAQTPMPSSPSNNLIIPQQLQINQEKQNNQQQHNNTQKLSNNSGLIIQNMSLNSGQSNLMLNNNSIKPTFKKRSKSPSLTNNPYQQKLQQKTVYMLLNNTFAQTSSQAGNIMQQQLKKPQSQSLKRKNLNNLIRSTEIAQRTGFVSPKKNMWND